MDKVGTHPEFLLLLQNHHLCSSIWFKSMPVLAFLITTHCTHQYNSKLWLQYLDATQLAQVHPSVQANTFCMSSGSFRSQFCANTSSRQTKC
ncbi:hypothetical protein M3J09_002172 [Ascochyta lentis]